MLVVFGATVALALSGALLAEDGSVDAEFVGLLFLPTWYVGLGAVLATRAPGNGIAWIFLLVGTGLVIEGAAEQMVGVEPPVDPTALDVMAIIWLDTGFFFALVIPLLLLLFVFPTGRFLNRRWVWAGWVAGLASVTGFVSGAFSAEIGPDDGSGNSLWTITNPIGIFEEDAGLLTMIFGLGLMLLLVMSVPAVVVRYRRSEPDVRAQIKWVLLALILVSVMFFTRIGLDIRIGTADYLFPIALAALPLSMTLAITRYRLFDIDRLISRTVTYTVVAAVLAVLYFGLITLITSLLPTQNALAVAGSTLAVAALFNPLRKKVQRYVDRRFNRSAYQAEAVSDHFAAKLRQPLTVEELSELWEQTVAESFQPRASGIWLNPEYTETPRP